MTQILSDVSKWCWRGLGSSSILSRPSEFFQHLGKKRRRRRRKKKKRRERRREGEIKHAHCGRNEQLQWPSNTMEGVRPPKTAQDWLERMVKAWAGGNGRWEGARCQEGSGSLEVIYPNTSPGLLFHHGRDVRDVCDNILPHCTYLQNCI